MKLLLWLLLLIPFSIASQPLFDRNLAERIELQLENHCFEEFGPFKSLLALNESWKKEKICTLGNCRLMFFMTNSNNAELNRELTAEITARLQRMAQLFYNAGHPVILTSGMDSWYDAQEDNEITDDDFNIIYIPYASCISSEPESRGAQIFNHATRKLIRENTSRDIHSIYKLHKYKFYRRSSMHEDDSIVLHKDGTFYRNYSFMYHEVTQFEAKGNWEIQKDTLILNETSRTAEKIGWQDTNHTEKFLVRKEDILPIVEEKPDRKSKYKIMPFKSDPE